MKNPESFYSSIITLRSGLISLVFCFVITGCTITTPNQQLVTGNFEQISPQILLRSKGSCEPGIFSKMRLNTDRKELELSPDNITILDWNIYKGNRPGWQQTLSSLGKEKDIILLQETPLNNDLQLFLQENKFYWNLNSAFKYRNTESGVLIAAKVEPIESCGLRQKEPIIGLPKTALISSFAIAESSQKLLVANVHGINFTLGVKSYQAQFNSIVTILEKHDGPIIVAGDLNNWSDNRSEKIELLVEKLSLTTFTFENDNRTRFFGDPVDHIFYRGLVPLSYDVVVINSSDHNAISASFRLKNLKD